jgi:hypothetical protein
VYETSPKEGDVVMSRDKLVTAWQTMMQVAKQARIDYKAADVALKRRMFGRNTRTRQPCADAAAALSDAQS